MTDVNDLKTAASRQPFIALLRTKESNALKALEAEVTSDESAIVMNMLSELGYASSSDELESELSSLRYQRRNIRVLEDDPMLNALKENADSIEEQVDGEIEVVRLEYDRQIEALKRERNVKVAELETSKEMRRADLDEQVSIREAELLTSEHPGLIERIQELTDLIPEVKLAERSVLAKAREKSRAIISARGRLVHLVRDASANAQAQLLQCTSTVDAVQILNAIPSVAEMIHIAENPDEGLPALVNRLRPTHSFLISAPKSDFSEPQVISSDEVSSIDATR